MTIKYYNYNNILFVLNFLTNFPCCRNHFQFSIYILTIVSQKIKDENLPQKLLIYLEDISLIVDILEYLSYRNNLSDIRVCVTYPGVCDDSPGCDCRSAHVIMENTWTI